MSAEPAPSKHTAARPALLIAIAFLAFVSIGLPDGVLGVAWPSIQRSFELPPSQLGWMLMMGTIGYLTSSFTGGNIVARLGVGRVVSLSSLLMVIALSAYALAPAWGVMVGFAVIAGLGSGAIDTGLNTYAAHHFSPRMVNWLHAFYGAGAMLGPLVMTGFIEAHLSWRWGYASLAAALLVMAMCFAITRKRWDQPPVAPSETGAAFTVAAVASPWHVAIRRPVVLAGVLTFFIYVGLEVATGQWAYSLFTIARGVDPVVAGPWISLYWGSLTLGRIAFGAAAGYWKPTTILAIAAAGVPLGALLIWHGSNHATSAIGLALMGFSLAPIFPLLISQTPRRVGAAHAAHAVGFQIAAGSVGAAAIPAIAGILARRNSLEVIGPYLVIIAIALAMMTMLLVRLTRKPPADVPGFPVVV